MADNTASWLTQSNIPPPRTEAKLLGFFGIPPDGLDKLDNNIARKRREWHVKSNGVSRKGRDLAKAVLELIQTSSAALKRGVPTEDVTGGAEQVPIPDDATFTLETLWAVIDDLLLGGRYDEALRTAADARRRWPDQARPCAAYAWVVLVGWQAGQFIRQVVLEQGLGQATRALELGAGESRSEERLAAWEGRIGLELALERPGKALAALGEADTQLGQLPSRLRVYRIEALLTEGRADEGMAEAARVVVGARGDRAQLAALRARCATILVQRLVEKLLPITSADQLHRYVEAVDVAAWCARGVPEAEDLVRVHRLWAAQAPQRVFAGSWELRSFLAVCTAFLSVLPHNRARSQPAWQIYAVGPAAGEAWNLIAHTDFVKTVHRDVQSKLQWAGEPARR